MTNINASNISKEAGPPPLDSQDHTDELTSSASSQHLATQSPGVEAQREHLSDQLPITDDTAAEPWSEPTSGFDSSQVSEHVFLTEPDGIQVHSAGMDEIEESTAAGAIDQSVMDYFRQDVSSLDVGDGQFARRQHGCRCEPLSSDLVTKANAVFVAPNVEIEQLLARSPEELERRIILIYDQPNSGRFFTAVRLAIHLLDGRHPSRHAFYVRLNNGRLEDLLATIRSLPASQSERSIFICADVFEQGVPLRDFDDHELNALEAVLHELESFVIFTAALEHESAYHRLALQCYTTRLQSAEQFFRIAIDNYNNHADGNLGEQILSDDIASAIRAAHPKIVESFQTSPQINDFFKLVRRSLPPHTLANESLLDWVTKQVDAVAQDAAGVYDDWFKKKLTKNEQLYALIVFLFKELSREDIHVLYRCVVSQLRRESFPIDDYRSQGIYDIYRAIKVVEDEGRDTLRFVNIAYEIQLKRQVSNRRDLLWTAMAAINSWINELNDISSYHLFRKLGEAIGRLGSHQWNLLQRLLDDRAGLQPGMPIFLVVYALRELIVGPHRNKVLDLVESWLESDQIPKMWTAALAIPELYVRMIGELDTGTSDSSVDTDTSSELSVEKVEAMLGRLASRFPAIRVNVDQTKLSKVERSLAEARLQKQATQLFLAVLRCTQAMFINSRRRTLDLLKRWAKGINANNSFLDVEPSYQSREEVKGLELLDDHLNQGSGTVAEYEILAAWSKASARNILGDFSHPNAVPDEQLPDFMELVELLLTADVNEDSFESGLDEFNASDLKDGLLALTVVRAWLTDPSRTDIVRTEFMKIMNRMSFGQRRRACALIRRHWLVEHPNELLANLAHELLSYAKLINGTPLELSHDHVGIILAEIPTNNRSAAQTFVMELSRQLSGLCKLAVGALGTDRFVLDTRVETFKHQAFENLESRSLLAMPALESTTGQQCVFALAVLWSPLVNENSFDTNATDFEDIFGGSQFPDAASRIAILRHRPANSRSFGLKRTEIRDYNFGLQDVSRTTLDAVDALVTRMLVKHLGGRSANQWQEIFADRLPSDFNPDVQSLTRFILELADQLCLAEVSPRDVSVEFGRTATSQSFDAFELMSGAMQWLLALQPIAVFEIVNQWLVQDDQRFQVVLSRAYLLMSLELLMVRQNLPSGILGKLFQIGAALARRRHRHEVNKIFGFVCHWINQSDLRTELMHSSVDLRQFCDSLPPEWKVKIRKGIIERKEQIAKTRPEQGSKVGSGIRVHLQTSALLAEQESHLQVTARLDALDDLAYQVMLEQPLSLPDLEGKRFVLLIVDGQPSLQRMQLARLGISIFKKLRGVYARSNIVPMLFRTGQCDPVAIERGIDTQRFFPDGWQPRPSLTMPVLECLPPERIACAVLLSALIPHDWDEGCEVKLSAGVVINSVKESMEAGQWTERKLPATYSPEQLTGELCKMIEEKVLMTEVV